MAGASLLALLDDIATLLDDVSLMTKVAAKKTAGVLGDDLALNAQQVTGVQADRELPVVWAVAKGSFRNKLILVPAALAISLIAPWAITPLLMVGGTFLCFEGFEKIAEHFLHAEEDAADMDKRRSALADERVDMVAYEKDKVKGAIRTDFILSAEIIVIALGTVADAPFAQQIAVLAGVGVIMTVGVYGIVGAIVKMDDAGLYLSRRAGALARQVGRFLLWAAPALMKSLSYIGTAAMFMVGGSILAHGFHVVGEGIEQLALRAAAVPGIGTLFGGVTSVLLDALIGLAAGAVVFGVITVAGKLFRNVRT
ncbi:DUF808 domain-containing protein [Noviherbaspirillum galbum]|uniref:DUF808 domain-containing protein n=1 Tax=Noviherbaspirillum galbum TaxID=2709383 RepID=A0A6B3STN9_9BURK|nr:DUF808 domain-containing protein [Noviherbaspirillum galbum]NEX62226.1 DUF808 domain-containing protein [Noviherbaspirillum galbum]